jgi:hypothetical protein
LGLKVESELVTVWIAAFSGLRMIPMERFINVAGAQLGPIVRSESRQQVVSRLLELMREAKARGSDIVVFPELALTTFFPRWWMELGHCGPHGGTRRHGYVRNRGSPLAAVVLAGMLVWRFMRTGGPEMLRMMNIPANSNHVHGEHGS